MRVFCLGGAGRIAREAVLDLATFGQFDRITVGDVDASAASSVPELCPAGTVEFVPVDLREPERMVRILREYDIVLDGTTISLNRISTHRIAEAGCHGVNLNGFGDELAFDTRFREMNRLHIAGFGMTPGVTNLMASRAASMLDRVDEVRISHGAFRPIAFSRSIAETTTYEYDPNLPGRVVYEDGRFVQVPPFARPRQIELPAPYGLTTQYIIPHSETRTLAEYLKPKGVRLIEVRGTWPEPNMRLIRALHEYGILSNPKVSVDGQRVGVLDAIAEHLLTSPEGTTTALYGYALHVEVTGTYQGRRIRHTLTHTHPPSDGSVPDWAGLRAYTRCVGIPLAIAVHLIASGRATGVGVSSPEAALDPVDVFNALRERDIHIQHRIDPMG